MLPIHILKKIYIIHIRERMREERERGEKGLVIERKGERVIGERERETL